MPINKHNINPKIITGLQFNVTRAIAFILGVVCGVSLTFTPVLITKKLTRAICYTGMLIAQTVYIPMLSDWILKTGKWEMAGFWRMGETWKMS